MKPIRSNVVAREMLLWNTGGLPAGFSKSANCLLELSVEAYSQGCRKRIGTLA
jgi:hypothetical protein